MIDITLDCYNATTHMIFPVWQKLAQSTHLLAQDIALLCGEKTTHTGTLDPMAEGVVVVLTGDDRYAKGLLNWEKQYRFSILWGLATDSLDQLGLVVSARQALPDLGELAHTIDMFPQTYEQTVPAFSAMRWQGKSGFELAREKAEAPPKTRRVQLSQISFLGYEELNSMQLLDTHAANISHVTGDFRQQEILESWKQTVPQNTTFLTTHHLVTTSPGTYIRQLVHDLAVMLEMPATTWSITREGNGPYEKDDCIDLEEIAELRLV